MSYHGAGPSAAPQLVATPRFMGDLPKLIGADRTGTVLPIGLRRSYGDSVLNSEGGLISVTGLDRFMAADFETGTLRAEVGVTLGEIMRRVVPHGFFLPVTPGTRFVTLGGAIANDVHGKNHHQAGTFGRHVSSFKILRHDGDVIATAMDSGNGLFEATIGGLGLTGLIVWAEIKLQRIRSSFLDAEIVPYGSLGEFWDIAENSMQNPQSTPSLGSIAPLAGGTQARGIFSRANWSREEASQLMTIAGGRACPPACQADFSTASRSSFSTSFTTPLRSGRPVRSVSITASSFILSTASRIGTGSMDGRAFGSINV